MLQDDYIFRFLHYIVLVAVSFYGVTVCFVVDAVLRESGQTGAQIQYAAVVKTLLSPPADY